MIRVSLTDNFSALDRALMVLERDQMPFAIARTLTEMAQLGRATITRDIPTIFSQGGRPKALTIDSVSMKSATKSTLAAEVFIKDKQAAYLQLEETGGTRNPRGVALVLPGSDAADLHDVHGNLIEGLVRRLRAAAKKAQGKSRRGLQLKRGIKGGSGSAPRMASAPARDSGIVYFSCHGPHGRGTGGYYERLPGGHLRRLVGFQSHGTYRPVFSYHARLEAVIRPAFAPALMRRLAEAIATGR
jgi:hypothetical protein